MSGPQRQSPPARRLRRADAVSGKRVDQAAAAQARGVAALERGDPPAAVAEFTEAVRQQPRDPLLRAQLGAALRAAGRVGEAIAAYRAALDLPADGTLALLHNNLGNALRDAGELGDSRSHFEEAIRTRPDYPEAWHNLGLTLYRLEAVADAEAAVDKAIALRPAYPDALHFVSQLAGLRGDFGKAVATARQAVELVPANAEYRLNLSAALLACGRYDEADAEVEHAARLAPSSPEVVYALGQRREQRGDREGAVTSFRQVIAAAPAHPNAYLALAGAGALDDHELAAAERAAAAPETQAEARATFAFAVARTYDRRKSWDRAFLWARLANELESARTSFDRADAADFVSRSMATFSREAIDEGPTGSADERPLFVVGFPRSGTSLVEQILASHPRVAAGGELVDIPDMIDILPKPYPDCVPRLPQDRFDRLVEQYRARLDRIDPRAARITDKLPFNFRNLGLIAMLFPCAGIIYCRRDPRDVAISCYFTKFHRPISFAQSLFDFGAYWVLHQKLMRHWRRTLQVPILHVDYEKLIAEPEPEIRRLVEFAGLPWDDRCLRFYATESIVRTASASQIRNPIYASAVGRWRPYAKFLAPLLSELDRAPSAPDAIARVTTRGLPTAER
jgi:Flp pilus assembly protein TadD